MWACFVAAVFFFITVMFLRCKGIYCCLHLKEIPAALYETAGFVYEMWFHACFSG